MLSEAFFIAEPGRGETAKIRLLNAAVRVFGEKGPEGATLREIARAAGQNVAAIAYYFGGKRKLYLAVIEGLVREIRHRLADVLQPIEEFRRQPQPSREEALRLLKQILGAVYLRLLSRREAGHLIRLIVREQLGPTPAFEILYRQGFRTLHELLCFLTGVALGRKAEDREVILRTHMIMGQIYFFAMSREAILRRAGWETLEGDHARQVVAIFEENLDALMAGLGAAGQPTSRRAPSPAEPSGT